MVVDEGKVKLEKFNGAKFELFWKMQIKDYLYKKKLYQSLSEEAGGYKRCDGI